MELLKTFTESCRTLQRSMGSFCRKTCRNPAFCGVRPPGVIYFRRLKTSQLLLTISDLDGKFSGHIGTSQSSQKSVFGSKYCCKSTVLTKIAETCRMLQNFESQDGPPQLAVPPDMYGWVCGYTEGGGSFCHSFCSHGHDAQRCRVG